MKKFSKVKNDILKKITENKYYILVVFIVLIITIVSVGLINNKLNDQEQKLYDIIENNKNDFKNPKSLKVVSAKICNDDYSIIRITKRLFS